MQRFDNRMPMNSISFSMIQTEASQQYSDESCTCGHDELAFGDALNHNKRFVKNKSFFQTFSKVESNVNYGTATEHEMNLPYQKQVADRFEAEYDYCMRWSCEHKYTAARVIPFKSDFYSVVRLLFQGKSWGLDCSNFKDQFDYSGWLPSVIVNDEGKKSLLTDSSEDSPDRIEAGRTLFSSDTGYGLQSLNTEFSVDSGLTKDPIDTDMYRIMGSASDYKKSSMENSLHSTLDNISPILNNNMVVPSSSNVSTGSSLKAVFHDLVELDQIFTQKVEEALTQQSSISEFVNCLTTAHSFSNHSIVSSNESTAEQMYPEDIIVSSKPATLSQMICLTGKKFSFAFWKNWSKHKN
uniref:Fork-head domain-containing protein n=1 Tax=Caenorhabditis tropicalis TaxID=1561998 RepID=A0A1I7UCN7_9PELO